MVHGQGDTNHGAANPLPSKDGSSEPAERAWRNPTTRPRHSPPASALGSTRDQPCSQPKPGLIPMTSGAGHLCSHGSQVRGWESPTNLSFSGAAPVSTFQHSSSWLGLSYRSTNWWRGRAARLYPLCCASLLQFWQCSHAATESATKVSLQLLKGEMKGAAERPRHWEQPGNTHCRSITLLQSLSLGEKTQFSSMAGWGGPVCQPGSSLGPNAAQASSCSPQSQAAGTQPLPTEAWSRTVLWGTCCCWFGSYLVCVTV